MSSYYVKDLINFYETVDLIDNENIKTATICIENDIEHCHKLRHLSNSKIQICGTNKPKYNIYLDPRQVSDNPKWKFNITPFWFQNCKEFRFLDLHFTYSFFEYDYYTLTVDFDEETKKTTEKINYCDGQILIAYGIVLMEFDNSKINFNNCMFENNTNRAFEIIAKDKSEITFENCIFNGDFNFIFDFDSKIIIKSNK
nr:hypothetical protein [uncultured Flavobacterium sp.]